MPKTNLYPPTVNIFKSPNAGRGGTVIVFQDLCKDLWFWHRSQVQGGDVCAVLTAYYRKKVIGCWVLSDAKRPHAIDIARSFAEDFDGRAAYHYQDTEGQFMVGDAVLDAIDDHPYSIIGVAPGLITAARKGGYLGGPPEVFTLHERTHPDYELSPTVDGLQWIPRFSANGRARITPAMEGYRVQYGVGAEISHDMYFPTWGETLNFCTNLTIEKMLQGGVFPLWNQEFPKRRIDMTYAYEVMEFDHKNKYQEKLASDNASVQMQVVTNMLTNSNLSLVSWLGYRGE